MCREYLLFKGLLPPASLHLEGRCEGRNPSSVPGPRGNHEGDAPRQGGVGQIPAD